MNKINFVTGEPYTLSEIFSEDRKIIIPDLQRDYCWGDKIHKKDGGDVIELVSGFIESIIKLSKGHSENQFGLLYGYESPKNHIQLCDGQQRITTLFLLIGVLNKLSDDNKYRQYLISDFEYFNDDREPYLQYSIRESSLYFLSDLVCHYFVKADDDNSYVEKFLDIKKCSWYYSEYDSDPSIQSMLNAIEIIEPKLNDVVDKDELADYVLNRITFMYYDMENRKNGEETFVVINLAGEPLSANQNLKPRVIAAEINEKSENVAQRWEEIETWFWKNRTNDHDTADAGFNEFLRWVTIIETGEEKFDVDRITFESIYKYWEAVKYLFEESELKDILDKHWLSPKEKLTLVDQFKLLPLIVYCTKFKISDLEERDCLRVYRYFENIARYESPSHENEYVNRAIWTVENMTQKDIVSILDLKNDEDKKRLLPEEEKLKLQILKSSECRESTENAFWSMQSYDIVESHKIWNGRITTIINWATENNVFSIDMFEKYCRILDNVFVGNCDNNINLTRRALLTRGLNNYPIKELNGKCRFCWNWEDWYKLIVDNNNKDKIKVFLDDLCDVVIKDAQKEMCKPKVVQTDIDEIIIYDYLIDIIIDHPLFNVSTSHLFNKLRDISNNWKLKGWHNLIVIENSSQNIKLDLHCSAEENIEIYLKRVDNKEIYLNNPPQGFNRIEGSNISYHYSMMLSNEAKKRTNRDFSDEFNIIKGIITQIDSIS